VCVYDQASGVSKYGSYPHGFMHARSNELQSHYQVYVLLHTVGIALVTGVITGVILPMVLPSVLGKDQHEDASAWEVQADYYGAEPQKAPKLSSVTVELANQKWRESQQGLNSPDNNGGVVAVGAPGASPGASTLAKLEQVVLDSQQHDDRNSKATPV
jgi:hypothetical protein